MTDQEHARAIAEQLADAHGKRHYPFAKVPSEFDANMERARFIHDVSAALSLTADTARLEPQQCDICGKVHGPTRYHEGAVWGWFECYLERQYRQALVVKNEFEELLLAVYGVIGQTPSVPGYKDVADLVRVTADTARAQAFEEAAKEVDVLIAQERERLRAAYTLPYDVPAQRIRSATITAYTVVVDLLRARATPGDTP